MTDVTYQGKLYQVDEQRTDLVCGHVFEYYMKNMSEKKVKRAIIPVDRSGKFKMNVGAHLSWDYESWVGGHMVSAWLCVTLASLKSGKPRFYLFDPRSHEAYYVEE